MGVNAPRVVPPDVKSQTPQCWILLSMLWRRGLTLTSKSSACEPPPRFLSCTGACAQAAPSSLRHDFETDVGTANIVKARCTLCSAILVRSSLCCVGYLALCPFL